MQAYDSLRALLQVAHGGDVESRFDLAARQTLDPEVEMILALDPEDAVRGNLLSMSLTRGRAAIQLMEVRESDPTLQTWIALQVHASTNLKLGVQLRELSIQSLEVACADQGLSSSVREAILEIHRSQQSSPEHRVETFGEVLERIASD